MAYNLRVHMAFFWFFLHSSVTNLCTLTWDRYIAIVHPFKYNTTMTKRRPGMVILMAWLIPFAISLLLCTAMKVLRLAGVTAFDIVSCVLLFYAVVCITPSCCTCAFSPRSYNRTTSSVEPVHRLLKLAQM